MWKEPYSDFNDVRTSNTRAIVETIRKALLTIDLLNQQSAALPFEISREIAQKNRPPATDAAFDVMPHLLHMRLQQMRG